MSRARIAALVTTLAGPFVLVPASAAAQEAGLTRFEAGLALAGGLAVGEFGEHVDGGLGPAVQGLVRLDSRGIAALRLDGGVLIYGHERSTVPVPFAPRVLMDVTTSNTMAFLAIGPRFSLPAGPLRPYADAGIGLSYLATDSRLRGSDDSDAFASTTNYDDVAFWWGGGGGVLVPLGSSATAWRLDLGVQYRSGGTAEYLREGDIEDLPDGGVRLSPQRSRTDLVLFRLGVNVPIARSGR